MTWRRQSPHARKAYWDGPGWPPEISQQTRDNAASAGWDAGGWASCRNAVFWSGPEQWFDNLPAFETPVPAATVAEMLDGTDNGNVLEMLEALAGGMPPCAAWLVANARRRIWSPYKYWLVAQELGLSGVELAGWWHAGVFENAGKSTFEEAVRTVKAQIDPWANTVGLNAPLWCTAGYSPVGAKRAARNGKVTEAGLLLRLAQYRIRFPEKLNDHGATPLERTPYQRGDWDTGWRPAPDFAESPVWKKNGWPPEVSQETRAAAASAGWRYRDWVGFYNEGTAKTRDWLWNMPMFCQPLPPDIARNVPAMGKSVIGTPAPYGSRRDDVWELIARGVPPRFATEATLNRPARWLSEPDQVWFLWEAVNAMGLTEQEAVGWLATGYLDVPESRWERGDGADMIIRKIRPWRKYGPSAYLFVLAGVSLSEAARSVKQPDWDEIALRVMLALDEVELPAGV